MAGLESNFMTEYGQKQEKPGSNDKRHENEEGWYSVQIPEDIPQRKSVYN